MSKLELPSDPTDKLKLADWLEILALLSADKNSSKGDLESALNLASIFEGKGNEAVEEKCLETFEELEHRLIAAGDAYPFLLDGAVLSVKPNKKKYAAYLFCLCLSYFRWNTKRNWEIDINPWLLFEQLSAIAAAKYIDGEVMNFGTARKATKAATRGFRANVDLLCKRIGEGTGFKDQDTLDKKDDKVDLVAWKDFADGGRSKLLLFGQCAGGDDWPDKVSDMNPKAFWDQWVREAKVSKLIRSFYVPHRISRVEWDYYARYAGIMFDRCRVSYWAFKNNNDVIGDNRYSQWCAHILKNPKPLPKPAK